MKYIRTKDGIYEIINIEYNEDIGMNQYFYKEGHINGHEVIIQADTIKELCDEFIYDFYGKHHRCYYSPNTKTWVDEESGFDLHEDYVKTIKGAIWTDKGLIYVAKINEKGKLELL